MAKGSNLGDPKIRKNIVVIYKFSGLIPSVIDFYTLQHHVLMKQKITISEVWICSE